MRRRADAFSVGPNEKAPGELVNYFFFEIDKEKYQQNTPTFRSATADEAQDQSLSDDWEDPLPQFKQPSTSTSIETCQNIPP